MKEYLLEKLRLITPEEQKILDGAAGIEQLLYTAEPSFVVDSKQMLARGQLIGVRPHTRFAHFPRHTHNYVELMYMCTGSATHLIGGATKVELNAGELLFLNQRISHEILPTKESDIGINFLILPEFFDSAFAMVCGDNRLSQFLENLLRKSGGGMYLHFLASDILPIQNLVENMLYSLLFPQENAYKINQTTMGLLLMQLLSFTDILCPAPGSNSPEWLALQVTQYIDAHYRDATLSELSKRLECPNAKLSRLISRAAGASFKELLQRKRFQIALELLSDSRLCVSDIIAAVGYENSSYFYRLFKERFGISPRKYRLQHPDTPFSR